MNNNYFLAEFDNLWKRELHCFEIKLSLYDKDTFEDDLHTYAFELARKAKAKILEFHYEALKNLYGEDDCSIDNFKILEGALSTAFANLDNYLRYI